MQIFLALTLIGAFLIVAGILRIKNAEGDHKVQRALLGAVTLPFTLVAAVVVPLLELVLGQPGYTPPMKGRRARPGEMDRIYEDQKEKEMRADTGGALVLAGILLISIPIILLALL